MNEHRQLYIDGAWVDPAGTEMIDVISASTEAVMGRIPEGTPADVDRAVAAARAAFDGWAAKTPAERAEVVAAIGEGMVERRDELSGLISGEVGMPRKLAGIIQVGLPVAVAGGFPAIVEDFAWQEEVGNSLVVREPVGVVAAITPWNYPLHQIVAKLAAALCAGCTVVLKPSEVAPLNAFALAEIVHAVGVPAGVFNLVSGTGPVVGEALAAHPDVDMVSVTGSTRAGRRVQEVAAATVKRLALELGGKSANILLPTLDDQTLDKAARAAVSSAYLNSGQTCRDRKSTRLNSSHQLRSRMPSSA